MVDVCIKSEPLPDNDRLFHSGYFTQVLCLKAQDTVLHALMLVCITKLSRLPHYLLGMMFVYWSMITDVSISTV